MSAEVTGERSAWQRLRATPLRDLLRGRLTGRLDVGAIIHAAGLPEPLPQLVREVVRRTRLFRLEKVSVAEELTGHFLDGLNAGRSPRELAAHFGEPRRAARLIGRAKRRNRPLAYRASVRALQAGGGLLGLALLLYGLAALRFFAGSPSPTVDYLMQINSSALAAPQEERAWPEYRAGMLAMSPPPKIAYDRTPRPGEPGWEVVEAYLERNRPALERVRAGAHKPVLGYAIGFAIAAEDLELWPRRPPSAAPASPGLLFGALLPHLAELHGLTHFLIDDSRRAAACGEADTALADLEAVLSMGEQVRGTGFVINDLVALAMLATGLNATGELLRDHPQLLDDRQLTALAHRVGALADGGAIRVSMAGERTAFADLLQRAYTDDGRGDGRLTWEGLKLIHGMGDRTGQPLDPIAAAAGPALCAIGASRAEFMEKYDALLAMMEADAGRPLWERGRSPFDAEIDRIKASLAETIRFLPIALLMPALANVTVNAELVTQRRDAVKVMIAMELYRRRHGAWPEDLTKLVPQLLPGVPRDRFDGGPIKYALLGGQPVLYVVGTDRDDDGGRTPPAPLSDSAMRWLAPQELEEAATGRGPPHLRPIPDGDWVLWPPPAVEPLHELEQPRAWPVYNTRRDRS